MPKTLKRLQELAGIIHTDNGKHWLNEVFDNAYQYTWEKLGHHHYNAKFKVKDGSIVTFNFMPYNDQISDSDGNTMKNAIAIRYGREGGFNNRDGWVFSKGGGDQFKIFATILKILFFFTKKSPEVEHILFSSSGEDGPSRKRLYTRMLHRFAEENGFKYEIRHMGGGSGLYILSRKKSLNENRKRFEYYNKRDIMKNMYEWRRLIDSIKSNNNRNALNEIFDGAYSYYWKDGECAYFNTKDGSKIDVLFHRKNKNETEYEIEFTRNGRIYVTGEGDQIKIFATVMKIAEEFTKNHIEVKHIKFHARTDKGDNRASLYRRLMKRLASKMNFDFYENLDPADPDKIYFNLIRYE